MLSAHYNPRPTLSMGSDPLYADGKFRIVFSFLKAEMSPERGRGLTS